jgi:hypothetical protein
VISLRSATSVVAIRATRRLAGTPAPDCGNLPACAPDEDNFGGNLEQQKRSRNSKPRLYSGFSSRPRRRDRLLSSERVTDRFRSGFETPALGALRQCHNESDREFYWLTTMKT